VSGGGPVPNHRGDEATTDPRGRWQEAGLPKPSVIIGVLQTIKTSMVERTIGTLDRRDLRAYGDTLRPVLGL
jgi:hypothetical protein